jgi:hypothetical protein
MACHVYVTDETHPIFLLPQQALPCAAYNHTSSTSEKQRIHRTKRVDFSKWSESILYNLSIRGLKTTFQSTFYFIEYDNSFALIRIPRETPAWEYLLSNPRGKAWRQSVAFPPGTANGIA